MGQSSMLKTFVLDLRYCAPFRNYGDDTKATAVDSRRQISQFSVIVKFRGDMSE